MQQIPVWKEKPIPVMVRCQDIHQWPESSDLVVQFQTSERHYTAFVEPKYVKEGEKLLVAAVIADVGEEGDWLVQIPVETLTSGPRFLVRAGERDEVLVHNTSPVSLGNDS